VLADMGIQNGARVIHKLRGAVEFVVQSQEFPLGAMSESFPQAISDKVKRCTGMVVFLLQSCPSCACHGVAAPFESLLKHV